MGIVQGARRMTAPWHDDARSSAIPILHHITHFGVAAKSGAFSTRQQWCIHPGTPFPSPHPEVISKRHFLFTFYSLLHTILYMLHNQHRLLLSAGFS